MPLDRHGPKSIAYTDRQDGLGLDVASLGDAWV